MLFFQNFIGIDVYVQILYSMFVFISVLQTIRLIFDI